MIQVPFFNTEFKIHIAVIVSAGFRRGQSGQLHIKHVKGPHKFWLYPLNTIVHKINWGKFVNFQSSLAPLTRTHRYSRLFGVFGNVLFIMLYYYPESVQSGSELLILLSLNRLPRCIIMLTSFMHTYLYIGFPGQIRKFDNQIRQILSCRENYHSNSFSYHSI